MSELFAKYQFGATHTASIRSVESEVFNAFHAAISLERHSSNFPETNALALDNPFQKRDSIRVSVP